MKNFILCVTYWHFGLRSLREKCPNTESFLVRIFLYWDQKKPRICCGHLYLQISLTVSFILKKVSKEVPDKGKAMIDVFPHQIFVEHFL